MKKEDKKAKYDEPFKPENTPKPPQVMDTSTHPESGDKFTQDDPENQNKKKQKEENKNEKRLGESPTEIDDETTI